ncbi:hypothetical protein [Geobacter pickeringii]|nr:hypothetical protein [Geobacter pickeringii]
MKVVVKGAQENKAGKQDEKLVRLVSELTKLVNEEFTGHIKINFSQGGIGRIEKFEEILRGR